MTLFLLTFDRRKHEASVEPIGDDRVLERLFEAERVVRGNPNAEVVLLTAADEDDLRRTHSRYFESVDELLTAG